MKKTLLKTIISTVLLLTGHLSIAQTFSDWGLSATGSVYDTINFTSDTLRFQFSNCPAGAFGQAKLVVYFEGDLSDNTETMDVYFAGASATSNGPYDSIGVAGPNSALVNCAPEDSIVFSFSVDTINAYAPNLAVIVIPNANVGNFCQRNRARVRIEYNYCPFGVPVEFASLIITTPLVCPLDGLVSLNGTPAGGTYTGTGINGNNFDPYGLSAGTYTITYTAADSIGCISSASATIQINNTPIIADTTSCPGIPITLTGSNISLLWFSDATLTNQVGNGNSFTTPPLFSSTSYYAAFSCNEFNFRLDTLLADSINIVDNNALVGDDRGGIAVTPQYVYYIADQGGIRYDADMTNPLSPLPARDGIFSDLQSGELYSLWDTQTNTEPQSTTTNFTVDAIITMNADLSFGTAITKLSQPINLGNANYFRNGIFAGAGILGLYSGNNNHFYVVNLCNGQVTDLDTNTNPQFRGTESWADWGVIEFDGTSYAAIYRNNTGDDVQRLVLPNGPTSSVGTFPAGIADIACLTYSQWNQNWYFHFEGVSGALGGTSESTGYANASNSMSTTLPPTLSCAEEVKVNISNASISSDTTLCQQNYVLFAGLGYSSYTWNGVNSNLNSYTVSSSDTVVFTGLYLDGCNHIDTTIITMNANPGVSLGNDISACGGPVNLDAGNSGSTFVWSSSDSTQVISVNTSGNYSVLVTDGNGCSGTDDINININPLPLTTLNLNPTLVCINWNPYLLTGGSPAGGTYSGTAVSNGTFIPSFAGLGTFAIIYSYTDSNGCSASDTQNVVVAACTGIAEPFGNGTINVAPNPGNGLYSLNISSSNLNNITIEVVDVNGKIVFKSIENALTGVNKKMDLTALADGIYVMKVYAEKQVKFIKLVIQK